MVAIESLPNELLDEEACVWLPLDYARAGEFPAVTVLSAFDASEQYSKDNLPSMNIEEH